MSPIFLDEFTIETAVKYNSITGGASNTIVDKADYASDKGYYLTVLSSGKGYSLAVNDDEYRHYTQKAPATGEWESIAAAYDKSAATTSFYFDQVFHGAEQEAPAITQTSNDLMIGLNNVEQTGIDGAVDFVRIMNKPLTPAQFLHYPLTGWEAGEVE